MSEESPVEFARRIECAMRLLSGGKVITEGDSKVWDELHLSFSADPQKTAELMELGSRILCESIANVCDWGKNSEDPEIRRWAQCLLADLISIVKAIGPNLEPRNARDYGEAFDMRWKQNNKTGPKGSDYAFVSRFASLVLAEVEKELWEIFKRWEEPQFPPSRQRLKDLLKTRIRGTVEETVSADSVRISFDGEDLKRAWDETFVDPNEWPELWEKILWPMAEKRWPKFARENRDYRGWKRDQRPLEDVLRTADLEVDLGLKRWKTRIENEIKSRVRFRRMFTGEA